MSKQKPQYRGMKVHRSRVKRYKGSGWIVYEDDSAKPYVVMAKKIKGE